MARIGIFGGLRAFFGGIGFIFTTPSVWGYAAVPAAMMLVLTCGFTLAGFWGAGRLSTAIVGESVGTWGQVGSWLLTILMGLMALFLAVLLALCLAQPLSGFALEAISHTQERALTGRRCPPPAFLAALFMSLRIILFTAIIGAAVLAGLFILNVLFPPALVVTLPLKFLVCGWMLAWNFLDYPLSLRGGGVRGRVRWVARHFGAFSTFGLAWSILLIVPGSILLLLPMGVAGATRLVVEGEQRRGQGSGIKGQRSVGRSRRFVDP
jgi:CysZ protein